MSIQRRLKRFLDDHHVDYRVVAHEPAFSAQQVAHATHVTGNRLAKVLVARDGEGAEIMAVLPASCRLNLPALEAVAGRRGLALVPEPRLLQLFPECEAGAMPPFGHLWDVPVYLGACFDPAHEFVFQAGNHREVVIMRYGDFARLENPVIGEFCMGTLGRACPAAVAESVA